MIADSSDRSVTSSEPPVDSDSDELLSELEFKLMAPNEAGLDCGEDRSDEWLDREASGDK